MLSKQGAAVLDLLWLADPGKSRCPPIRFATLQILEVQHCIKTKACGVGVIILFFVVRDGCCFVFGDIIASGGAGVVNYFLACSHRQTNVLGGMVVSAFVLYVWGMLSYVYADPSPGGPGISTFLEYFCTTDVVLSVTSA